MRMVNIPSPSDDAEFYEAIRREHALVLAHLERTIGPGVPPFPVPSPAPTAASGTASH